MSTNKLETIKLRNVRLSFPSIFNRSNFDGKEGKYEATFLIPKSDTKTKKILDEAIKKLLTEAKIKVSPDKICLKDGDDSSYDGYADHWSLKAGNNKRFPIYNNDKTPLTESDNVIYAGCYVHAIIDFWVQNNQYGKRVNANLYALQFHKDGEAFGMGVPDVSDQFDDESSQDEDDI